MALLVYIAPFFGILILVDYLFCRTAGKKSYLAVDSWQNLAIGTLAQLTKPFLVFFTVGAHTLVYDNFRLFTVTELNTSMFCVAIALHFILIDFCGYLSHRATHRINFLWGTHIIHHQSECFNLTVALRQTAFGALPTFIFYLPVALLGLSPAWFLLLLGINLFYQFIIHTEAVDKLGFLEKFMNTPSHHRVHHGRNSKYIDKNYGGVFIVWDKLLGTFQPEEEKPDYGVTTPPSNLNPITANLHFYQILWQEGKKYRSIVTRLALWFMPPERIRIDNKKKSSFTSAYRSPTRVPAFLFVLYLMVATLALSMTVSTPSINPILLTVVLIMLIELPFWFYKKWSEN